MKKKISRMSNSAKEDILNMAKSSDNANYKLACILVKNYMKEYPTEKPFYRKFTQTRNRRNKWPTYTDHVGNTITFKKFPKFYNP